jgi:peroxiredoxin family protein/TusA-related sulfurtransferase/rhodanese-related sulfurtransferase
VLVLLFSFIVTLCSYLLSTDKPVKVLDVRPRENAALHPIPGSLNIPHNELQGVDLNTLLDKDFKYKTVCQLGKTAYFASRCLENQGFDTSTLVGGLSIHKKLEAQVASEPSAAAGSVKVEPSTTVNIDCTGLSCPGPLLKLKESIQKLPNNATLNVTATDPGFKADVKAFAASNGLVVQSLTSNKGIISASLARAEPLPATTSTAAPGSIFEAAMGVAHPAGTAVASGQRKGATIVVFSQDFDKVLASFVIANGAAAMGGEVTMFFTFWGLNALRDANRNSKDSKNLIDSMFGFMMPKGKDALPLSNMNFGGMGAAMMKSVMAKKNLPNIPDLMKAAKAQNIRMVACTMSMDAMGIRQEELIDGVELGGVAEYLGAAEKSGTNLFI